MAKRISNRDRFLDQVNAGVRLSDPSSSSRPQLGLQHFLASPIGQIDMHTLTAEQHDRFVDLELLIRTFVDDEVLNRKGAKRIRNLPNLDSQQVIT